MREKESLRKQTFIKVKWRLGKFSNKNNSCRIERIDRHIQIKNQLEKRYWVAPDITRQQLKSCTEVFHTESTVTRGLILESLVPQILWYPQVSRRIKKYLN